MDPLSAASSAFSVISLAIQLGDSINKLCNFLSSIAEAPKEIEFVIDQLRFFTQLLDDIQNNQKIFGPDPAIMKAVERCEAPIKELQQIADSLVPGFAASSNIRRKWTALTTVKAKEKMVKFQEKLQAAKLDLILARTLSADRAHQHYYQSYQESLVPMVEGLAEIRNMLSYQSETITLRDRGEHQTNEDISSEIQKAFASWPFDQFRSTLEAELRKGIDTAIARATEQASQTGPPLSTAVGDCHPDCETLLERYQKGKVAVTRSSTTKSMVFGEMHYISTSYLISPKSTSTLDMDTGISKEQLQVETSFSFVPSWWVTRFMTARAVKIDVLKLSTQGWQANMHSFNIIPKDSPIFEFCREGNLDAVRYLIGSRKAAVNDMTEEGWTPLHFAASRSQAKICALLLQEGAQQRVRDSTRFKNGRLVGVRTSNSLLKETIREFIKAGEDFADAIDDETMPSLISAESWQNSDLSEVASRWLLNDILPAINPAVLDGRIWEQCLESIVYFSPGNSLLPQILRRADTSMARKGIMEWIYCQSHSHRFEFDVQRQNDTIKNFQMLVEKSGGLNFIHEDVNGTPTSPLFAAMPFSCSFSSFRVALQKVDLDIRELIRFQIETYPNGWTLENLLSLSLDSVKAQPRDFIKHGDCKLCGEWVLHPDQEELAWKRKVDRIKHGVDLDAPLNEEEERQQKDLDDAIVDFENGICHDCHKKKKTKKCTWIPFG